MKKQNEQNAPFLLPLQEFSETQIFHSHIDQTTEPAIKKPKIQQTVTFYIEPHSTVLAVF